MEHINKIFLKNGLSSPVFFSVSKTKKPLIKGWNKLEKTTIINNDDNIALIVRGLFVLDIDNKTENGKISGMDFFKEYIDIYYSKEGAQNGK